MVSAVVFDLDGTLFDHSSSARRGLRQWLAGLDVVLTNELASAWFEAEERHVTSWREGVVSWAEQRRRRLRDFLPLIGVPVGTADDLDEAFVAGYLLAYERNWAGYDDVDAALNAVHGCGVVTAMLTNGAQEQQEAKLAHLGLLGRMGPVFTAEGLGVAKPPFTWFARTWPCLQGGRCTWATITRSTSWQPAVRACRPCIWTGSVPDR
jgi:putative hydrolase of the HAD superfamily